MVVLQTIAVATLGSRAAAQRRDSMREEVNGTDDLFYLQYFFPPSSVGEVGRVGAPGERRHLCVLSACDNIWCLCVCVLLFCGAFHVGVHGGVFQGVRVSTFWV